MIQLMWRGPVFGQSGYERITREILIALDELGVMVELVPAFEWNVERISLPFNYNQRFQRMISQRVSANAPVIMHQKYDPGCEVRNMAQKFIYTLFETDKIPSPWRDGLMKAEHVFVFSDWNKKMWVNDGFPTEKITALPFGVNCEEFDPATVKPAQITNKKGYVFLANGDFTERKNFDLLIEAYCKEFQRHEDVTLILKCHYGGFVKPFKENVYQMVRDRAKHWSERPPKILVFADKLSEDEVPKLYASAHCFVLPSRGEGLGLPYIEAMASGLPVIATGWGAQEDYIKNGENGILLNYDLRMILDVEYIKKCPHAVGHSWAEANLIDLRTNMRRLFENRNYGNQLGLKARESMQNRSWKKTAMEILKQTHKHFIQNYEQWEVNKLKEVVA